jgi:hypothetical protein
VWRQCEKDKTTEITRNVFIPIDVLGEVGTENADEMIQLLSELTPRYLGGGVFSALLGGENPSLLLPPCSENNKASYLVQRLKRRHVHCVCRQEGVEGV